MKTRELAKKIVEQAFLPDLVYNDRINTVKYYLEKYAADLELPAKHQEDCICMYCEADRLILSIEELQELILSKMS